MYSYFFDTVFLSQVQFMEEILLWKHPLHLVRTISPYSTVRNQFVLLPAIYSGYVLLFSLKVYWKIRSFRLPVVRTRYLPEKFRLAVSAGSLPFMASRLICTRISSPGLRAAVFPLTTGMDGLFCTGPVADNH